jgi:hypothetical protein
MTKRWFGIILFLYTGLSLLDAILFGANAYIEQASWNNYFKEHLLIRLVAALITGILLFMAYRSAMPEQYEKRKDKPAFRIFAPLLMLLATFLMNTLIILPLNQVGDKQVVIDGTVAEKYYTTSSKGGRNWFLVVTDKRQHHYKLQVRKNIYQEYNQDSAFDKTMTEGMLGIIYRKEE